MILYEACEEEFKRQHYLDEERGDWVRERKNAHKILFAKDQQIVDLRLKISQVTKQLKTLEDAQTSTGTDLATKEEGTISSLREQLENRAKKEEETNAIIASLRVEEKLKTS